MVYSFAMSTYLALYRKWRPRNFAGLVGQEHVARTLSNAITGNKLAHAYLFTGPRGTGKTSSARIFAKSLNCAEGPTVTPCERCAACEGISRGNFPDVIEIDAASNRGVDDARDLRDRVRFAPTQGRYKVFIIDEVHMLTNEAFNALLKTIEEPPPNLVFVLATTDVHKVLPTIISRCQRFDFQRIAFKALIQHLGYVSTEEGLSVDPAGIAAIAKRADGGLRDALSLLDQVRACAPGTTISAEDVFNALGLVSNEALTAVAQAIADAQVVDAITGVHALLAKGYDHHAVLREMVETFRHLMLVGLAPDRAAAFELPDTQVDALKAIASRFSSPELLYALEVLRETEDLLKGSNQMTIWLELAMIRLCERADIPSIANLTRRIEALEERLANGAPAPGRPAPARQTYAAPQAAPVQAPTMSPPPQAPTMAPPVAAPAPSPMSPVEVAPQAAAMAPGTGLPFPSAHVDAGDAHGTFLASLARVHRSTHSLLEQHALYVRRDGDIIAIAIKATMRTFFEKADRKAYLDKAAAQAFGDTVRTALSFEQGDTPRPNLAGVSQAPAAPQPQAVATPEPSIPTPIAPPPVSAPPAAPRAFEPEPEPFEDEAPPPEVVSAPLLPPPPAPVAAPVPTPPAPKPEPQSPSGNGPSPERPSDLVSRAADIFNGKIIEPTI
ncbi:DNA polymerase III subunit gamma/tau [bacterium]|nr:DNA polymerase III subunit gamma/tau [bacterium]